jgi:branched-chain amino acid transport system substrate-binding protein
MKKLIALLMALCMVLALASCGSSSSESTTTTKSDASSTTSDAGTETSSEGGLTGTLKLGGIGPVTGAAATYGMSVKGGAEIAVEEINALGNSFSIEFNFQDDEHDAEKSVNAYHTLQDWGAQAIVGSVTTNPCIAVSAEAYSDRMFMLTPSASSTDVTNGKDNVFQLCFTDPNQGVMAADYIADNSLAENVAIIYNNSDAYSTGIYQAFKTEAESKGLSIVSETTFASDDNADFSVQLKAAQDAGADLVFLPIYYTPASNILKQANTMGYDATFFGVDGMDGILGVEGFDTSLAEGVLLMTPFAASDDEEFSSEFESNNGFTPTQFAADGYDCVYAIYQALEFYADKNGGLDVTDMSYSDLCEILISVFTDSSFSVDGLTGDNMHWSTNGEVNKDPKVYVIKDGAYSAM